MLSERAHAAGSPPASPPTAALIMSVGRLKKMAEGLNIGENGEVLMTRPGHVEIVEGSQRTQRVCNRKCEPPEATRWRPLPEESTES